MPHKKGQEVEHYDVDYIIHCLELLRKNRDLSKAECARRLGMTQRHFRRITQGKFTTIENLNGYASLFGMELRLTLNKK